MRPLLLVGAALLLALPARAENDGKGGGESKPPRADNTFMALSSFSKTLAKEKPSPQRDALLSNIVDVVDDAQKKKPEERERFIVTAVDRVNTAAAAVEANKDEVKPETIRVVRHGMADVNIKAGNYDEAAGYSSRAIEYDPKDRDAYIQHANATWGQGKFDQARQDATRAIELDPKGADGFRARAMASYGLGDYLQAAEDARRALALDPEDRTAFAILKLTEGRRNKTLDMDALRRRAEGEIVGEYHGMLQQLNQAEDRRKAVDAQAESWAKAGAQAAAAGAAIPSPTAAADAALKQVRAAAGQLSVKDYAGALAAADKALATDPNNTAAYYYRAAALNLLGRYDEAVMDATKALALNNHDPSAHDTRAYAYNHMGRYRDAVADSNHSLEINPKNPYAYANLGYSHEKMGDLAAMLRDLKVAASLNPQFEPVYEDAAARHGLEVEALSAASAAARAAELDARKAARRNQFVFVIGSAILGGLLIAFGVIHLFLGARGDEQKELAASLAKPPSIPAPVKLESAFQLGRTVGMGGMGIVYEAVDRALERKVAIKMVRDELKLDAHAKQRFLDEARTVAALHHPNVIAIHQIVDDASGLYLVFEFVDGRTVADVLAERGRLSLAEAKGLMKPICAALDYAHKKKVVHRDLKPGNVMLASDGMVKVMDFGISRHVREAGVPTAAEGRTGTPEYMAPEQRYGVVRPESDVFSLGTCLYEMVTGRRPFAQDQGPFAAGEFQKASTLVPDLPPSLDELLSAALQPDPEKRIRSAKDFWALLERVKDAKVSA